MFINKANTIAPRPTFNAPALGEPPTLAQAEELADEKYTDWVRAMSTETFTAYRDGVKENMVQESRRMGATYVQLSRAAARLDKEGTLEALQAFQTARRDMEFHVGWYENWEDELAKLYTARWGTTEELNDWAYQANRAAGRTGRDDG